MNEFDLYDSLTMPLSNDQELRIALEKVLYNIPLTPRDKILLGRDHPIKEIDGYVLKTNCVYRAVSVNTYNRYLETGYIYGVNEDDEYEEILIDGKLFNNNKGVDWFLGGVCLKYGEVIIECPALKEYFVPAYDNGTHLSFDPLVRHMKSSGYKNAVPMSLVRLIRHPNINVNLEEVNYKKE